MSRTTDCPFVYAAIILVSLVTFDVVQTVGTSTLSGKLLQGNSTIDTTIPTQPSFAYVANIDGGNVSAYVADLSTGALTEVPSRQVPVP